MTVVALPLHPGPVDVDWLPQDFGGTLPGALGGAAQRVNRLGNRWAVTVTMPPMSPDLGRQWFAALVQGLQNGVSWRIRQVGTPPGSPGSVLVAGAAQAGSSLALDGFTPGYPLRMGQWLSVLTGGRRYLYQAGAMLRASATGTGTATLTTPLRVTPADNDPVEIGAPVIEGLLKMPPGFRLTQRRLCEGFSFTIEEMR